MQEHMRQVGYLQGSYQDARSTKHKISEYVIENKIVQYYYYYYKGINDVQDNKWYSLCESHATYKYTLRQSAKFIHVISND